MLRRILHLGSVFGRAGRREFTVIFFALLAASAVHLAVLAHWPGLLRPGLPLCASLAISALIDWIFLAVLVRRLHDLGKTGWLLIMAIVPIVGFVFLAWGFFRLGAAGPNRYGPAVSGGNQR